MKNHHRNLMAYKGWTGIFAMLLIVFAASFYFIDVSAQSNKERALNRDLYKAPSDRPAISNELGTCQNGECVRNGKIAFERDGYIQTINPDGSGYRFFPKATGTRDASPSWSPDGRNIVFVTDRDGNPEIYRVSADGSNPIRLTNNPASDGVPSYSPDGSTIVFSSNRDGEWEVYKMNADGSDPVRLTNDVGPSFDPAFSHDGQKIVYVSGVYNSSTNPRNLYTMNVDGSNQQQIPGPPNVPSQLYNSPSYSPDGSKLIVSYTPDLFVNPPRNWTMNADGTGRTLFGGYIGSYSPDGSKVVYTNYLTSPGQPSLVFVANSDGSSPQGYESRTFIGGVHGLDWQPVPITQPTFDYDGDGRSDVSVFRPSDGVWHLLRSQAGYTSFQFGLETDVLAPADYDGDLKTDLAVWRPSEGNFYILNSSDGTVRTENFGLEGDVPTGGDWDGDGKADVAVYRGGAQGTFYYRGSLANPQGNITNIIWGTSDDKAVAADFDGDGQTDAAIFRPSNGIWYVRQSSNGQLWALNFGLADDVLVPADYDADGKADPAVYRDGIWYLWRSTDGFAAFQFGNSTDVPVPADYDGDGRADAAIYRDGIWWILDLDSGSADVVSFGLSSDKPAPSAFVR